MYKSLKFQLTNAQIKVLREIRQDFKSSKPMNRLIQGDVGCGKTDVAVVSLLSAISSGFYLALTIIGIVQAQKKDYRVIPAVHADPIFVPTPISDISVNFFPFKFSKFFASFKLGLTIE